MDTIRGSRMRGAAAALLAVLGLAVLATTAGAQEYRFLMVSHMGPNDSNSKWFELSLATFEEKFPNVTTEYISTSEYSTSKYIQLIEQAVATNPDGLAVAITNPEALEGAINKAIDAGIPVIAFNTSDPRPQPDKIDYLTYVGGDEFKTGLMAGEHALAQAAAGTVPQPARVLCANPDPAHNGLVARCAGMTQAMGAAGVETEVLITDADPSRAASILTSYLRSNDDVNFIYTVTGDSGPTVYRVVEDLGRGPEVDGEGMTIIGVDANPDLADRRGRGPAAVHAQPGLLAAGLRADGVAVLVQGVRLQAGRRHPDRTGDRRRLHGRVVDRLHQGRVRRRSLGHAGGRLVGRS